jgi:hypothetical protein
MKVMKGLRYMTDKSAKLDTTMVSLRDATTGDVVLYNPIELDEASLEKTLTELGQWGVTEATTEVARLSRGRSQSPVRKEIHSVKNLGGEIFQDGEAAQVQGNISRITPSAFQRSGVTHQPGRGQRAKVVSLILPTRQSLLQPIKYWTQLAAMKLNS